MTCTETDVGRFFMVAYVSPAYILKKLYGGELTIRLLSWQPPMSPFYLAAFLVSTNLAEGLLRYCKEVLRMVSGITDLGIKGGTP